MRREGLRQIGTWRNRTNDPELLVGSWLPTYRVTRT